MPQDSPSISATVVDAEAIVTTEATAVMPISVMITPTIALRIGSPAATNAPKVTSRMTKAMIMPMSSGVSEISAASPGRRCRCTPPGRPEACAGFIASLTASRLASVTLAPAPTTGPSRGRACPLGEIGLLWKGVVTADTCGIDFSPAMADSIAALSARR